MEQQHIPALSSGFFPYPVFNAIRINGNIDVVINLVDNTKQNAVQVQGLPNGMTYSINNRILDVFKLENSTGIQAQNACIGTQNVLAQNGGGGTQIIDYTDLYGNRYSSKSTGSINSSTYNGMPVPNNTYSSEPPALVYITANSLQTIITLNGGVGRSCTINGNVTTLNVESYDSRIVTLTGNVTTLNVVSGYGYPWGRGVTLNGSATILNASVYNNMFAANLIVQQANVTFFSQGSAYVNAAKVDSRSYTSFLHQFINTREKVNRVNDYPADVEQPKPPKPW